jgi:cytidylate kinase
MIVAFAGGLGSGKSTLSSSVATALGWPRTSFGTYVRSVAAVRELPDDREALQELGAELMRTIGPDGLTEATLKTVGWNSGDDIVLDGVRHEAVLEAVCSLAPCIFVFIAVSRPVRAERLALEGRLDDDLAHVEQHSTEAEVESRLRPRADLVLDGTGSVEVLTAKVVEFVRGRLR